QLRQIAQVVEAGDSTGGDHRSFRAGTHRAQQLQVRATQCAVLADVGDHVTLSTVGVQPLQYLPQVSPVGGPAAGGEPVFVTGDPHVQPDGHAVAVLADDARGPLRVLQRGGAQIDATGTGSQSRGQRLVVADAAGQLDVHVELPHHRGEQLVVVATTERGVEVDQVNPLGTVALPREGSLAGRSV